MTINTNQSSKAEILKDELAGHGYPVVQVFYKNNFPKKSVGWFAELETGLFFLGVRFHKAIYNIHHKQIKIYTND